MTIKVEIEGKGVVAEFEDGTPREVIDKVIKRDFFPSPKPPTGATGDDYAYPEGVQMAPPPMPREYFEAGGLMVGGAIGAASPVPGGTVVGGGLGMGIGGGIHDVLYGKVKPTLREGLASGAQDVSTGMMAEMGGQVAGKAIGATLRTAGKVGKQIAGRITGAGPGAAEEAVKGGKAFTEAMRGKISGEEIVDNAKQALNMIKNKRSADYQKALSEIGEITGDLDTTPVIDRVIKLMKKFNIRMNPDGTFDYTRTAVGRRGIRDLKGVMDVVKNWGSKPGDKTPLGLDTLKRQLDDFWSESSNARAFVSELRNEVRNVISKNVPEYANMTKGYAEATRMIKDIEQGLTLKKAGISGRVVADQTLRRLMSAMRDNFQLRKELLDVLSAEGGVDLSGQIAGLTMSSVIPRGLAGVTPSVLGSAAALKYLNPKWVPLIVSSSPRVMGEFLRMVGMVSRTVPGASMATGKAIGYFAAPSARDLLSQKP